MNSGSDNLVALHPNVLGQAMEICGRDPVTGFYRDGSCRTDSKDLGTHTVCAILTDEFLRFSKSRGNDLTTPKPEFDFPGLKAGDRWCLCANRWREAFKAGVAPSVLLKATHRKSLEIVELDDLLMHAVDIPHNS